MLLVLLIFLNTGNTEFCDPSRPSVPVGMPNSSTLGG